MTRPRARQAGVTLIELILVTALLLALLGLSAPLFKRTLEDLSAKNTSFSISKLMNYAQEMAVLERRNYKISFDFKLGKYQLVEPVAGAKQITYKKVTGRFGKSFRLPRGLSFSGSKNGVVFYPDGHCDEIKLAVSTKGGGYSLTIKRFGNMVEIKPFEKEVQVEMQ